ncbi:MAG: glycosyltransferase family 2 protein [Bacilli bacterium]|nr:glycosyltransferase family 2 protein [Bacilli bacterium]
MIDIIIPAYNAKETIFKTLASISLQTIKNSLNVYIVNDASDYNYQEEISFFKNWINIVELTLSKNSGPGIARQYGIDNSNSEYIMFIDADDTFYNCYSVELLYKKIKETKTDLVISNILYERDNKREKYEANFVYMHGKIYKRSYLINNNIKFNDTRANEDNGFNNLLLLLGIKYDVVEEITYIYRENASSITRKNNREYKFLGLEGYSYNLTWALNEAIKRDADDIVISFNSYKYLLSFYYYYQIFIDRKDKYKILNWISDLKKIYLSYKKYKNILINEKIEDIQYKLFSKEGIIKKCNEENLLEFLKMVD